MDKRVLVTFGRSDPRRLTEIVKEFGDLKGNVDYAWGPEFGGSKPKWAKAFKGSLYNHLSKYDVVYCGHGATLMEATAMGCEVRVLSDIQWATPPNIEFIPAWTGAHLDHSGRRVDWWEPGVMAAMARELRDRRGGTG